METAIYFAILIALGLIIGTLVALTGASGVLIIVPMLSCLPSIFPTIFPVISPEIIIGTSLLVDVIASLSVTSIYIYFKNIRFRKIWWIIGGCLLGSLFGSFLMGFIPKGSPTFSLLVSLIISIGMFGFAIKMFQGRDESTEEKGEFGEPIPMMIMGIAVGILTRLFGAGGGIMIFLVLKYLLKFSTLRAVGTSTLVMLFSASFSVGSCMLDKSVDFRLSLIIGIPACIAGIFVSRKLNLKKKSFDGLIGIIFILGAIMMIALKVASPLLK